MASENSNDNDDDWLGRVEKRVDSEFAEGCMPDVHKYLALGYKQDHPDRDER